MKERGPPDAESSSGGTQGADDRWRWRSSQRPGQAQPAYRNGEARGGRGAGGISAWRAKRAWPAHRKGSLAYLFETI